MTSQPASSESNWRKFLTSCWDNGLRVSRLAQDSCRLLERWMGHRKGKHRRKETEFSEGRAPWKCKVPGPPFLSACLSHGFLIGGTRFPVLQERPGSTSYSLNFSFCMDTVPSIVRHASLARARSCGRSNDGTHWVFDTGPGALCTPEWHNTRQTEFDLELGTFLLGDIEVFKESRLVSQSPGRGRPMGWFSECDLVPFLGL